MTRSGPLVVLGLMALVLTACDGNGAGMPADGASDADGTGGPGSDAAADDTSAPDISPDIATDTAPDDAPGPPEDAGADAGADAADDDTSAPDIATDTAPDDAPGPPEDAGADAGADAADDSAGDAGPCPGAGCPDVPAAGDEVAVSDSRLVGGPVSSRPGFSLYVQDGDLAAPGTSTCAGSCALTWPPLQVLDGKASGAPYLGTITRADGTQQATHKGRPLYFYSVDAAPGDHLGDGGLGWHSVLLGEDPPEPGAIVPLYDASTSLEPVAAFVREDGVVVTRIGDRGRDRHAKEEGPSDRYDHYLAHYWEYRTARIQLEDHVPNGESRITATYITEEELGAREFRVWYWGMTTPGQFHFNPQKQEEKVSPNETGTVYEGQGTWDDDFVKISDSGHQHRYSLDIVNKWENGGQSQPALAVGTPMEFEVSQFLLAPPAGKRLNYYGTSYVYVIGQPGVVAFEWERGVNKPGGANDGTPIPPAGLLGGDTTLGFNYSGEPAGRFMQMATNLSHRNGQPFVRGRRVHHTSFTDGSHDERDDNPVWPEQSGKAGPRYIHQSCSACHVRNGRALVADPGEDLDKWVFKVGDNAGEPLAHAGRVLQPKLAGPGAPEGAVSLGAWTEHASGLRSPNYVFAAGAPPRFSARIAPQLVGIGLLDAVPESQITAWADPDDADGDGISGRAARVVDPETGDLRLGRFGYKAATFSVRHQVAAALNTDIGVMTSVLPTPDCGSAQDDCGAAGAELADEQLEDLVKYISLLGVGARRDYQVTAGETEFTDLGCGSCHRPTLTTSDHAPLAELRGQTIQPYTDLLLHDMGLGLADTLGEGDASGAEWRTAPLWGLGHARDVMLGDAKGNDLVSLAASPDDVNRIGYLHDGRARTIDEAIRWHGGEAEAARAGYEELSDAAREALLDFLGSL